MEIKKFDLEKDLNKLEDYLRCQYLENKNMTSWLPERLHDLIFRMDTQYTDDEAVNSVINFLGYEKDITLIRTRYVFKKEDIKVEIDDYISPNKMFVVAIEGNVNKTSKIYNELKEKYYKYFINI